MRRSYRVMRWSLLWSLIVGMLAIAPFAAVGATDPGVPLAPPPATAPIPDHRAEQEYFASLRQAPGGTSAGQARAAAVQQARSLPDAPTLPAALGGKGTPVGKIPSRRRAPFGSSSARSHRTRHLNPIQDYHQGLVDRSRLFHRRRAAHGRALRGLRGRRRLEKHERWRVLDTAHGRPNDAGDRLARTRSGGYHRSDALRGHGRDNLRCSARRL